MGHDRKTRFVALLVGLLGALGGIGVMASGLGFGDVPMKWVLCACALGALGAALAGGRKTWFLLPLVLGLITFVAWKRLDLERSLESALYFTTRLYNMGYGWGFIRWSGEPLTTAGATVAACVLGLWLSAAIAGGFLSRGGVWLGAFAAALPLLPVMVLTDTVPDGKWLYLQLLSLILLLMCSRAPKRGLYLTLPVALCLGLLFLAMPRETYKGQDAAERVGKYLEELLDLGEPGGEQELPVTIPDISGTRVDLSAAGPRPRWLIPVMHVKTQEMGTVYLRGMAFDTYTGTHWEADGDEEMLDFFTTPGSQKVLEVQTLSVHESIYFPYGAQTAYSGALVLKEAVRGRVENTKDVKNYYITYVPPDLSQVGYGAPEYAGTVLIDAEGNRVELNPVNLYTTELARYLQLPEETRIRAEEWLRQNLSEMAVSASLSQWDLAGIICEAVRRSAPYDLGTQRMPQGEDFAMWFLEESETGYCVHFASAAAVLLRAAGIPSRYVSGYVASCVSGEKVTVYQKNAHAWVEVFVDGSGWVMLEPTPGDGVQDTVSETTAPPETTQETTEPTQTTQSSTLPEPSTGPAPTQKPTSPTGEKDGPDAPEPPKPMPKWLKALLWALGGIAALAAQWRLRVALGRKLQRRGNLNRQVLALWQEAVICGWLLKARPPEEFHQLAQKARFSQHASTRQERQRCDAALRGMKEALKRKNLGTQLLATLVLALY